LDGCGDRALERPFLRFLDPFAYTLVPAARSRTPPARRSRAARASSRQRACEAFSAMTTDRPYRKARPHAEALAAVS
jgi:hypothetical protein